MNVVARSWKSWNVKKGDMIILGLMTVFAYYVGTHLIQGFSSNWDIHVYTEWKSVSFDKTI